MNLINTDVKLPSISVIICTYNSQAYIKNALESLVEQRYPSFEIIMVDDASTDSTVRIAEDALSAATIPFRILINEHNSGVGASKNRAAAEAQGDILAIIDSDGCAPTDWLMKGSAISTTADIWGGPFRAELAGIFNKATYAMQLFPRQRTLLTEVPSKGIPGTNMFIKKKVFEALGGFKELRACEDLEFVTRAIDLGFTILFDPDITVWHPWSFSPRQYFRRILSFKQAKRNLPYERKRRILLYAGTCAFVAACIFIGPMLTLAGLLIFVLVLYLSFFLTYFKKTFQLDVALICSVVRLCILLIAYAAYFQVLPFIKNWKK